MPMDDPRSPGNTLLGAVRQCGSGRSLGRDRQVNMVRGCVGLLAESDLTPTPERRHRGYAPRRRVLIGHIGSGGKQRQLSGGGAATTQSMFTPLRQILLRRAVHRISALSRSRQHVVARAASVAKRWGSGASPRLVHAVRRTPLGPQDASTSSRLGPIWAPAASGRSRRVSLRGLRWGFSTEATVVGKDRKENPPTLGSTSETEFGQPADSGTPWRTGVFDSALWVEGWRRGCSDD